MFVTYLGRDILDRVELEICFQTGFLDMVLYRAQKGGAPGTVTCTRGKACIGYRFVSESHVANRAGWQASACEGGGGGEVPSGSIFFVIIIQRRLSDEVEDCFRKSWLQAACDASIVHATGVECPHEGCSEFFIIGHGTPTVAMLSTVGSRYRTRFSGGETQFKYVLLLLGCYRRWTCSYMLLVTVVDTRNN